MEHIKAKNGKIRKNSEICTAIEYEFEGEKAMNSAVIELDGRYPENDFALNTVCEEIIYVIEGSGRLVTPEAEITLAKGDMLRIKPNEKYYFEGSLKLLISSSPVWHPGQYRNVQ